MDITKATGEIEAFSEDKLRASINRAGIPIDLQNAVVAHIKEKLYKNIPTSEIYQHIVEFLEVKNPYAKTKYRLKQSIMELGPTGYPFEDFIARLLKSKGYTTEVRQILSGKCITHEVDVVATKGSQKIVVEAKYHNMPGTKTNIHVALYTKARFNDLLERNNLNEAWLVTNTKVTTDAITYALCMGMKIISWNYPEGESLRDMVEQSGLIPITALSSLSQYHKQKLVAEGMVISKDLCEGTALESLNLSDVQKKNLLSEIEFVCKAP